MNKVFASPTLKSLVAACAVSATALGTPAAADGFGHGESNHGNNGAPCVRYNPGKCANGVYPPRNRVYRKYHRHDGDAAAAAILGLAGVAIIAGALSNANPPVREYRVAPSPYPPAPARGPNVITYESALQPWSPEWYRWCDARYRSFNPQTGTYRGYDGLDHFCVPR